MKLAVEVINQSEQQQQQHSSSSTSSTSAIPHRQHSYSNLDRACVYDACLSLVPYTSCVHTYGSPCSHVHKIIFWSCFQQYKASIIYLFADDRVWYASSHFFEGKKKHDVWCGCALLLWSFSACEIQRLSVAVPTRRNCCCLRRPAFNLCNR